MSEIYVLISLVVVMLVGSYLAGSIPLFLAFSEDRLQLVSVFGAGLLVGTALTVIIPEGVRALGPTLTPSTVHSIGLSLVLGFICMLLVEQISKKRHSGRDGGGAAAISATVGLVVHAAADGVALGAAATTSHADVELIVFLAIMLHKAPAAFGLVTYLLHEGVPRQRVRRHLAVFAGAAPAATLITYFGIGQEQKDALNSLNATGIAMLFSAGTFLYVATVHVLAELTAHRSTTSRFIPTTSAAAAVASPEGGGGSEGLLTPLAENSGGGEKPPLKTLELLCLVVGCLTPLLLAVGHSH